jgi:ATP-dependent protease ClpP protease subunit
MLQTHGRYSAELHEKHFGKRKTAAVAARMDATLSTAEVFAGLRCPKCRAPAASYSARSGEMKCFRGHRSGGTGKDAGPLPTSHVKAVPAASPTPAKREPLPGNVGHAMLQGRNSRSPVEGLTAGRFNRDLDSLRAHGARAMVVHVASDGGDLGEAEAMALHLQFLAAMGVPSVAHVSNASSAGSVVALSCSYSVTAPDGRWFIHNPHHGDAPVTAESLAVLDSARERLHALYRARTVLSADEIAGLCGAGTGHFSSCDAWAKGLTDEVGDELRACAVALDAAAARGLRESPRRLALVSRGVGA